MHNLILFASGRGSNVQAIINYFGAEQGVHVALIVTNKADAGVLRIAQADGIPTEVVDKHSLAGAGLIATLQQYRPSLIVLAGFLLKIPPSFIEAFRGRIVNIHPALLPLHGGKGMWGEHVHRAVLAAGDTRSGITIHLVDEEYDHGATVLQAQCPVLPGDSAETLAARILQLEHFWYPRAIRFLLSGDSVRNED